MEHRCNVALVTSPSSVLGVTAFRCSMFRVHVCVWKCFFSVDKVFSTTSIGVKLPCWKSLRVSILKRGCCC